MVSPTHECARIIAAAAPYKHEAGAFHRRAQHVLEAAGWQTRREVLVPNRGDGRRGRIDLEAVRDGQRVLIELDHMSPRKKSLAKLRAMPAHGRLVVLRNPAVAMHRIDNVLVFGVEVQP